MKDLSALTKQELIKIIEEKNLILQEKDQRLQEKEKKILDLEVKLKEVNAKFNKILKQKELKNYYIKLNNHNQYYSKGENTNEKIVINEVDEKIKNKPGRKSGSKNFEKLDLESLVSKTITNDLQIKNCSDCGNQLNKIKEETSYKISVKPKQYFVTKIITPVYECKNCRRVFQSSSNSAFYHSSCTPSLASSIINAKYVLGVPLYRQSKYMNSYNLPISEMDLVNYVAKSDELLEPLYEEIANSLMNTKDKVIFIDETPLKVLDYQLENKKNGYIFAYVSSYYNYPIYLYDFSKTRETDKTCELLKNYKGYVVTDGYAGYNELTKYPIKIQRCFAHIRRKFFDIVKTLPENLKEKSVACKMVNKIDRLFFLENKISKLSSKDIFEKRHSEVYLKAFNDVYDYLHSIKYEEGTPLEKAIKYFLNLEEESKTFMLDGHIPISNNICERAIKPFTIMRRNFLFSKTENGANISARLFTIVQTATANGLSPEKYLTYVLENIYTLKTLDLLPWSDHILNNNSLKS